VSEAPAFIHSLINKMLTNIKSGEELTMLIRRKEDDPPGFYGGDELDVVLHHTGTIASARFDVGSGEDKRENMIIPHLLNYYNKHKVRDSYWNKGNEYKGSIWDILFIKESMEPVSMIKDASVVEELPAEPVVAGPLKARYDALVAETERWNAIVTATATVTNLEDIVKNELTERLRDEEFRIRVCESEIISYQKKMEQWKAKAAATKADIEAKEKAIAAAKETLKMMA